MALDDSQKAQIRRWLGYPDVNRLHHPGLEGAMDAISPEGEVVVEDILAQLLDVDVGRTGARSRLKALEVEEIKLNPGNEGLEYRKDGRSLVCQLAATLDVQVHKDVFSTAGAGSSGVARRGA